jgi:hypothetical protein
VQNPSVGRVSSTPRVRVEIRSAAVLDARHFKRLCWLMCPTE